VTANVRCDKQVKLQRSRIEVLPLCEDLLRGHAVSDEEEAYGAEEREVSRMWLNNLGKLGIRDRMS